MGARESNEFGRVRSFVAFASGMILGMSVAATIYGVHKKGYTVRRLQETPDECTAGTHWQQMLKVPRLKVLQALSTDLPSSFQTGPDKALLFMTERNVEEETASIPSTCQEVAVVVQQASPGRCLALSGSAPGGFSYRVTRHEMLNGQYHPISRIREGKQRMPSDGTRTRARTLMARLLSKLEEVNAALEPILEKAARATDPIYKESMQSRGAVLVMCINAGNLDLLLNFVLSACHTGINVDNLVVFAADAQVESALRAARLHVFRHPALGDFKAQAARSYGDHQFVEMMWLKLTCVFLVNNLNFDLLFQDADLIWFKNPWPFFAERPHLDTFWMDDGARTSRFAPYYPNTGFYLIRANTRSRLFNNQLLASYSLVLAWQSHQALVSQVLAESHAFLALSVHILDKELFPSGKQFHHNKPLFNRIQSGDFVPFCFHMCWTAGKDDKLKFLKQINLWFLPSPDCDLSAMLARPDSRPATCIEDKCHRHLLSSFSFDVHRHHQNTTTKSGTNSSTKRRRVSTRRIRR